MVQYNSTLAQFEIVIPLQKVDDLLRYQRGILKVLGKIEIGDCNSDLKENLMAVYEILDHLGADTDFTEVAIEK